MVKLQIICRLVIVITQRMLNSDKDHVQYGKNSPSHTEVFWVSFRVD